MKIPIHCPICHDVLLVIFPSEKIPSAITKTCQKRLEHTISLYCEEKSDQVQSIVMRVKLKPPTYIKWSLIGKLVGIMPGHLMLPWFEPDFSDYKKLMDKIKTYLLFS